MRNPLCCGISRRQFFQAAGGTAAYSALVPFVSSSIFAQQSDSKSLTPIFPKAKADVSLIFTHWPSGKPTWPTKDYDYDARKKQLTAKLKHSCPDINFKVETAQSAAEAESIVKRSGESDGFLVYVIGLWTGAPYVFLHSGKPVVMVDDLYAGSGEFLIHHGKARRDKMPVVAVSSSDFNDVVNAANLFKVIRSMKESIILDIVDADISERAKVIKSFLGTEVVQMDPKELVRYYSQSDEKTASEWAGYWMNNAESMIEPTRKDMLESARMYQALSRAAADYRADAVTMDCLGLFNSKKVSAYPCFSHFQMNNDGGTGVCESDLNSTCTQLMMRYMTGRPGYVSDPVIDTSKNEIIYAHCVATNRVFGPEEKANPYIIRSHAEDGKGASIQSLIPVDEIVTTLQTDVRKRRMVIHTARATRNVKESKACRTKLAAETNVASLLDNWDLGWHRVTVYGDWRKQVIDIAQLLGAEVFEEDKA